jgi:hypothetical protein
MLKRMSSSRSALRATMTTPTAESGAYVDWRRARPDVLVLREAGPSHDVPPFESVELVNASARLGEAIKATLRCCCSFFASRAGPRVLAAPHCRRCVLSVARVGRQRAHRRARDAAVGALCTGGAPGASRRQARPSRGRGATRCRRRAPRSICALIASCGSTWLPRRDPIELGVGTYVTVTVFFVVQSVLVLFFAPFTRRIVARRCRSVCSTGSSG